MNDVARPAHLEAAYQKGRKAAVAGLPRESYPYIDRRTAGGRVTFSRAFINAWLDGFDDAIEESKEEVSDD